jgi:hypothetical protein
MLNARWILSRVLQVHVATRETVHKLPIAGGTYAIAWHPKALLLACTSDKESTKYVVLQATRFSSSTELFVD